MIDIENSIAFNKKALASHFVTSALSFAASIFLLSYIDTSVDILWWFPKALVYLLAIFAVCQLLGCFFKIFDNRPAMILAETGIVNGLNPVSNIHIPWSEITDVETYAKSNGVYLALRTKNDRRYIHQVPWYKRLPYAANLIMYGSPLVFPANTLETNFDETVKLIVQFVAKHRQQDASTIAER